MHAACSRIATPRVLPPYTSINRLFIDECVHQQRSNTCRSRYYRLENSEKTTWAFQIFPLLFACKRYYRFDAFRLVLPVKHGTAVNHPSRQCTSIRNRMQKVLSSMHSTSSRALLMVGVNPHTILIGLVSAECCLLPHTCSNRQSAGNCLRIRKLRRS
eukprot:SAG31_NODE_144_length_22617_cov_21.520117_16_plen_158_part_00